ncbi:MAG: ArsR/SmtB family transcription factor [Candidatus Baltobacteraceae bacterium]
MSMQRCCVPARIARKDFNGEAMLLKAVADPYRLKMLATLASVSGEVCVCDFADALPLNQPTVSHHLRLLRDAGLISSDRRGTWVYYRLEEGAYERLTSVLGSVFRHKVLA